MIKIAVDARPLTRKHGGIKRYATCILNYLIDSGDFQVTLYLDREFAAKEIEFPGEVQLRVYSGPSLLKQALWLTYVQKWLQIDQPDIFWSPRHHLPRSLPQSTKSVVTIHDVIWKSHPESMKKIGYLNEFLHMPRSIQQADLILVPSDHTAAEIKKFWLESSSKVCVIKHGTNPVEKALTSDQVGKEKYLLAVGTLEPRKNYSRLIRAFDSWASINLDYNLLIVGRAGWKTAQTYRALENLVNSSRVRICTDIGDAQLQNCYRNADAFIQVSIAEGFGLPVMEAQAHGLPLLLSDLPVFREVANYANVTWVDPLDTKSIETGFTSCLQMMSQDSKVKPRLWTQAGKDIASKFRELASR